MDLSKIISITGKPGLCKVIGKMKNGTVVESLEDGKRFPVLATQPVSALADISIYTDGEDMPLAEVFGKMNAKLAGKSAPGAKASPEELQNFLADIVPTYDREKVYVSDIRKMARWYNTLSAAGLVTAEKAEETKEEAATEEEVKPADTAVEEQGADTAAAEE